MATEWKKNSEPETGYHLVDDRPFARGGSGEVWKAVGPGGIRVVLKRVQLAGPMAEAERKSLELLRSISAHPHLMGIHGFWIHDTELVMASELAAESLADRLSRSSGSGLPLPELLEFMEDAAKGLDFLNSPIHEFEDKKVAVQHRDIKPANLLVVGGSVKLSDFGLAKALEQQTTSHTGVMTPAYAAPEAFLHQTASRSDQYSLAASYVELRTGHVVFAGSVAQVMYGHIHGQPDLTGLTPGEQTVLRRALAKDPAERFETCREFVSALREALAKSPASQATTSAPPPRPVPAGTAWPDELRGDEKTDPATATASPARSHYSTTVPPAAPPDTKPDAGSTAARSTSPARPSRAASNRLWIGLLAAAATIVVCTVAVTRHWNDPEGVFAFLASSRRGSDTTESGKPGAPQSGKAPDGSGSDKNQSGVAEPTHPRDDNKQTTPPTSEGTAPPGDSEPPPVTQSDANEKPGTIVPTETREPESGNRPTAELPKPPTAATIAELGYSLLKKYCYRCHGVDFRVPGYNVLDRDILLAKRGPDMMPYITPGKPDESALWERAGIEADMPPAGAKPSDEEKQLLRNWIELGAPFPQPPAAERPFQTEQSILTAIVQHLRKVPIADRQYQRFFTLTHLYNNKIVRDDELRLYRAALSKTANSVSWKHSIAVPRPIDDAQTILCVDLRDLGWDENNLWKEVLKIYPYGLKYSLHRDEAVRDLAQEAYRLAGSDMPYLRADWFIANAARPPLYHTLLRMHQSAIELEQQLKVDVEGDFLRNKLVRAGFATSGVSSQNRIVDRHASVYGAYWKSYDFRNSEGRANIFQNPLGPTFRNNPFARQAFEHAGGEIIFSLPNGLHGFLLVDNKGNRIDEGPIDIVHDELKTSGTPTIVTGLSCMSCHKHGIIRFQDTLRDGQAVAGEARDKVELLTPKPEIMDDVLSKDEDQYVRSLEEAAAGFLRMGEDRDKNIRQFPEPVGAIARLYLKDLGPEEVACELGLPDVQSLQGAIRGNPKLRELGLGPIMQNAKIKREAWETLRGFNSPMQESARELEQGTPFRVF
jgi:serine/threonine protein kinase